jgi:two-component system, chemotaxis family, chemotaxis protein CheY
MSILTRFIIVDDDDFNNKICTATIEKLAKNVDVKTFLDPLEGFVHIATEYAKPGNNNTAILFLDLDMPSMNGWEFLERFDGLEEQIKERIKIYILSSSINGTEMARAHANKYVQHFLIKPLTGETIRLVAHSQNRSNKK